MTAQTHLLTSTGLFWGITRLKNGEMHRDNPASVLGPLTETGAFPDRHDVQVKNRLAWLVGDIDQSEFPPIRRDLGDLISDMRFSEPESRGIPRLCSGSQGNRKSNIFRPWKVIEAAA